jgi:hypothetical protein
VTSDAVITSELGSAGYGASGDLKPGAGRGHKRSKGIIAPGADADFVVLTGRGEVMHTMVGGRINA